MGCIANEDGRRESQEYKNWLFALTNDRVGAALAMIVPCLGRNSICH
jgi:hypothetical protein